MIPVYDQFAHTLACLQRARRAPAAQAGFEVIVVDDGSSDATARAARGVAGLRYHRRARQRRLHRRLQRRRGAGARRLPGVPQQRHRAAAGLAGCAAAHLRCMTRVPAWSARSWSIPTAGCRKPAASCSPTAARWNYGRFESPDDPRYALPARRRLRQRRGDRDPARRCSERLGGFDPRYAPAYYEDTDLAFAVREAGLRVLYQPAARVVHDEGATAGTDTAAGIKAYQVRNQRACSAEHRATRCARAAPARHACPRPRELHRAPAPGAGHRCADAAAGPRLRFAAAGQPDAPAARGRRARGVPAGQPRARRALHRRRCSSWASKRWYAPFARARAGLAARTRRALRHGAWSAATTSLREFLPLLRLHAPQAQHRVRHRRPALPARTPRAPNSPATRRCCARPKRPRARGTGR